MSFKQRIEAIKRNVAARNDGKWEFKEVDEIGQLAERLQTIRERGALNEFVRNAVLASDDHNATVQILEQALNRLPKKKIVEKKLTAAAREKLPKSDFAIPEKEAYPIEDRKHAANAKSRVAQFGTPSEKARVNKKVKAKYPDMGKNSMKNKKSPGFGFEGEE